MAGSKGIAEDGSEANGGDSHVDKFKKVEASLGIEPEARNTSEKGV